MEFKGTKGKWHYRKSTAKNGSKFRVENSELKKVCNVVTRNILDSEFDARLISFAPEMLEMLQKIVLVTESFSGTFMDFRERYNKEIKQLIKKATEL